MRIIEARGTLWSCNIGSNGVECIAVKGALCSSVESVTLPGRYAQDTDETIIRNLISAKLPERIDNSLSRRRTLAPASRSELESLAKVFG